MPDIKQPIRLALVDDHPLVLEGLSSLLSHKNKFTISGTANTGATALELLSKESVDVILLDNRLPDQSGIEVCKTIRKLYPEIKVIILTSYLDDEAVMNSIHAGAHGYLLKEVDVDELTDAILQVQAGETAMPARVTQQLMDGIRHQEASRKTEQQMSLISAQELRVMELVTEGCTNKEIASQMNLSDKTVKNYLSNIFVKLDMQRRSQVAAFYTQYRKTRPNDS